MPNHFHWLLFVNDTEDSNSRHPLNQKIGTLFSSYTQSINKRYDRTGSLFQQKTKSIHIDSKKQAITTFFYIHQNPIRAQLVGEMADWPYSSVPDYMGKRRGTLVNKECAYSLLDLDSDSVTNKSKKDLDF
ncbi:hypothetical protein [Fodinibius halophilus]|nr:hypothetical protein [Fodinibius halophilus]